MSPDHSPDPVRRAEPVAPHGDTSLFGHLAQQRLFIYLATALLSAAGIWAAFSLPSAIYPELLFSRVTVVAEGTALGARQEARRWEWDHYSEAGRTVV